MGSRKTAEFSDTVVNHSVNVNGLNGCEGDINLKWTYLAPKNCSLGPVCPLGGRVYEGFTLWLFNSSPWYRWPIEIDDCPIKTSIYKGFSMAMLNNQMVTIEFMGFYQRLTTGFTLYIACAKRLINSIHRQCTAALIAKELKICLAEHKKNMESHGGK